MNISKDLNLGSIMPSFIVNIFKSCFLNRVSQKLLMSQKQVWKSPQKASLKLLTDTNLLTTMFTDQQTIEKTSLPSNIIEEHLKNLLLMINLYENILAKI